MHLRHCGLLESSLFLHDLFIFTISFIDQFLKKQKSDPHESHKEQGRRTSMSSSIFISRAHFLWIWSSMVEYSWTKASYSVRLFCVSLMIGRCSSTRTHDSSRAFVASPDDFVSYGIDGKTSKELQVGVHTTKLSSFAVVSRNLLVFLFCFFSLSAAMCVKEMRWAKSYGENNKRSTSVMLLESFPYSVHGIAHLSVRNVM